MVRIVLAGAGYTNVDVAPYLKRALPNASITLISRKQQHTLTTHLPELLTHRRLEQQQINLEKTCKETGVEFIQGTITHIDAHTRTVFVGGARVPYDYLLVDLGSEPDTDSISGLQHAHTVRDAHSYMALRQHVVTEILKARNTNHAAHKTFVVAGSGVTAIETATELNTLTKHLCERHLLFPEEVGVVLIADQLFSPIAEKKLAKVLEEQGIEVYQTPVQCFHPDGVALQDRVIATKTLVWTKRNAHHLLQELGVQLSEGAAVVDRYLRTTDERIFAAGDNASFRYPVPRTAFMAFDEQRAVADNIIAALKGKQLKEYAPRTVVPIVITTGEQKAFLILGPWTFHGSFPYKLKNWFAKKYARRVSL